MRFASLGSGSEGNGLVVEVGDTRVLIDCGFRLRDTVARLVRLGLAPESIAAILVTHEHQDHIGGVAAFARRYRVPVWLTFVRSVRLLCCVPRDQVGMPPTIEFVVEYVVSVSVDTGAGL